MGAPMQGEHIDALLLFNGVLHHCSEVKILQRENQIFAVLQSVIQREILISFVSYREAILKRENQELICFI